MIWSSITAMVIFDVVIVALVVTMLIVSWYLGMFRRWRVSRAGRFMIIAGVTLTGLFYLTDLIVMTVMPDVIGTGAAMALMSDLHLEFRWPVSILSLFLIVAGVMIEAFLRERLEIQIRQSESQVVASQEQIVESEIRFRSLIEQAPLSLYCFEFTTPVPIELKASEQIKRSYDATLIECNQVFAETLGKESPAQAIGMRYGDLESAYDTASHTQLFSDFIEQGYRLVDYVLKYTSPDGEAHALMLSMSGVVKRGKLRRVWGSERDVRMERETKAALADRLKFQDFVGDISKELLTAPSDQADPVLVKCLEQFGRYIGADRAAVFCFADEVLVAEEHYSWSETVVDPLSDWTEQKFPWILQKLLRGESLALPFVDKLSEEASVDASSLRDLGVIALIAVPLFVAGSRIGACIFSDTSPRVDWGDDQLIDLQLLANLFASKLVQTGTYQQLNRALSELRDAKQRLEAENVYLREEIESTKGFDELVGQSDALLQCLNQVVQVAETDAAVLLQGETGTGKELIARAIHERSNRKNQPIVKVNCAALPANLIESELFGHQKGAFTGAVSKRPGRFEVADGGTLMLDEIADIPLELQAKLLRVLQSGEFERLGGDRTIRVDVRVIAATNKDLVGAIDAGEFRSDLFYRINTFPITLPPLRDRGDDIRLLTEHFVHKHAVALNRNVTEISASMMERLRRYDWPGNVRELEGVVQRALISSQGEVLTLPRTLRHIPGHEEGPAETSPAPLHDLQAIEREHIRRVLEQSEWTVTGESGAATKLGVPPSTLRSKMKKLGISTKLGVPPSTLRSKMKKLGISRPEP